MLYRSIPLFQLHSGSLPSSWEFDSHLDRPMFARVGCSFFWVGCALCFSECSVIIFIIDLNPFFGQEDLNVLDPFVFATFTEVNVLRYAFWAVSPNFPGFLGGARKVGCFRALEWSANEALAVKHLTVCWFRLWSFRKRCRGSLFRYESICMYLPCPPFSVWHWCLTSWCFWHVFM